MTKHFAVSGIAHRMLFGLSILVMASQAAMAKTTTLICNADAANVWKDDEPTTIELNETQSSVAVHISSETSGFSPGTRLPAHASGPLAATFAADTISFSDQGFNYTLNRLTGSLSRLFRGDVALRWTCQPGKKQF